MNNSDPVYIVYRSVINNQEGYECACSTSSDLAVYLNTLIHKFNYKANKNISFYTDETLEGDSLQQARQFVHAELQDLLDNYHVDADPNGFGRSALKVHILGKDRILNHFSLHLDKIIYSLNGMLGMFDNTIAGNGRIEVFGLGYLDVLDWHIIWQAKGFARQNRICTIRALEQATAYVFRIDDLIDRDPNIYTERLEQLVRLKYLSIQDDLVQVTKKGLVVEIWCNYTIKKLTITTPPVQ